MNEDNKHLLFIHGRLQYVHNENPNVDYMRKLKAIALDTRADQTAEAHSLKKAVKQLQHKSSENDHAIHILTKERDDALEEVARLTEFIKFTDQSRIECDQVWVDKTLDLKQRLEVARDALKSVQRYTMDRATREKITETEADLETVTQDAMAQNDALVECEQRLEAAKNKNHKYERLLNMGSELLQTVVDGNATLKTISSIEKFLRTIGGE